MGATASPERFRHPPRWLAGDWSRLVRDPLDLMRLALLAGVPVTLILGPRDQSLRLALTFGLVLIPRALDAPRPLDLLFLLGMYLQAWGNVFGAFDHVYGYDKLVHFVLPCASSALTYLFLVRIGVVPDLAQDCGLNQRAGIVLTTWALGLTFGGGLYELHEWFSDRYLGAHLHVSYGDTIADLTDDTIGSLLGGLLVLSWNVRGFGTRRRPGAAPARVRAGWSAPAAWAGSAADPLAHLGARIVASLRPRGGGHGDAHPLPRLPHWLAGDWDGPLRDPIDVLRLVAGAGVLVAIADGDWEKAVRFMVTFAIVLAARRLELPRPFDALFTLAMLAQAWGGYLHAPAIGGNGVAVHLIVTFAAAPVIYVLLVRLRVMPDLSQRQALHRRLAIGIVGFCFGFSAGLVYEIYVYLAARVLGAQFAVDYDLLIARIGADALGALGGALLLVGWNALGWGTRRVPASALAAARRGED